MLSGERAICAFPEQQQGLELLDANVKALIKSSTPVGAAEDDINPCDEWQLQKGGSSMWCKHSSLWAIDMISRCDEGRPDLC